jgi:phage-related protein
MTESIFWVDPDDGVTELDCEWDATGRFAPNPVFEADGVPGQSGQRLRFVRHDVHEFAMKFWLAEDSEQLLRTTLRSTIYKMDPTRGIGRLRVIAPGGDSREIFCRVSSGLGISEVLGEDSAFYAQRISATFLAHDPYWYAVGDTAIVYTGAAEVATFFPFFPLRLSASSVFVNDTSINNPGDLEAWPVWTIEGPGSNIVFTNITTSQSLTLNTAVSSGQSVTIDTRPGAKTVLDDDGNSLFPLMTPTSTLFPLTRGDNHIQISMDSTSTTSAIRLAFRPRYFAA